MSGQELEDFTQKEANKIIESLKGETYYTVNKILEKAKLRLEKQCIIISVNK